MGGAARGWVGYRGEVGARGEEVDSVVAKEFLFAYVLKVGVQLLVGQPDLLDPILVGGQLLRGEHVVFPVPHVQPQRRPRHPLGSLEHHRGGDKGVCLPYAACQQGRREEDRARGPPTCAHHHFRPKCNQTAPALQPLTLLYGAVKRFALSTPQPFSRAPASERASEI